MLYQTIETSINGTRYYLGHEVSSKLFEGAKSFRLGDSTITPRQIFIRCINRGIKEPRHEEYAYKKISDAPQYKELFEKYGRFNMFKVVTPDGNYHDIKKYGTFKGVYIGAKRIGLPKFNNFNFRTYVTPKNKLFIGDCRDAPSAYLSRDDAWPDWALNYYFDAATLNKTLDLLLGRDYYILK